MSAQIGDDTTIEYQIYGEGHGDPLLIINGTALSSALWSDIAEALSTGSSQVICYDHRGIGASTRGSGEISMAALAADAAALLDALETGPVHVLGWSLGSGVAQELAIRHPDRVRSLILANTWERTDGYQRALYAPFRHLWSTGQPDMAWRAQSALSFSPELLDSPALEQVMAATAPTLPQNEAQRRTVAEQWGADLAHDTVDRLPSIACPTLVISGEQDLVTPPRRGAAVAAAIPGAELHAVRGPGSSHALAWERQEEFLQAVGGFLDRHQ
jgi:pimeloyl-ACP methyl ester carboxylesterase